MRRIGFSTGALAFGDFERGVDLQRREGIQAIELSALREHELAGLIGSLSTLDLSQFEYKSFHAPSSLEILTNDELVVQLKPVVAAKLPIILHPDIIDTDFEPWRALGDQVFLENMDVRKSVCRTAAEMLPFFKRLPDARFCLDVGHARQVDPTMSVAVELLLRFHDRLAQVHISEVNWRCQHRRIGAAAAMAFHRVAKWIPETTPIIIESVIREAEIDEELQVVRKCLDWRTPLFSNTQPNEEVVPG